MDSTMKPMDEQLLENVDGGAGPEVQSSNFCRRCRGASYELLRTESDGTQLRKCKTCGLEYKYRSW